MKDFDWIKKLQSALIDALRENHGDCLIELGLPKRIQHLSEVSVESAVLYRPYGCPAVFLGITASQSEMRAADILKESLLSLSIEPGSPSFLGGSSPMKLDSLSFQMGIWFPISEPTRDERYDLAVIFESNLADT
jgi:hypothetical protein